MLYITLDTSNHSAHITGNIKATGDENLNGTLILDFKPSDTPVKVTKPAKSKNIMQLLDDLGLGGLLGSGGSASPLNTSLQ